MAYTDGSKMDGKTGAGVIIYKENEAIRKQSYSLPGKASFFQAELEAVRQAASFFNKNQTSRFSIIFNYFLSFEILLLGLTGLIGQYSVLQSYAPGKHYFLFAF